LKQLSPNHVLHQNVAENRKAAERAASLTRQLLAFSRKQVLQARVFEPFFTTKKTGEGTSLGLATCHGIAKQSGGHIAVYSELGHGTSLKVLRPRVEAPVDAAECVEPPSAEMPRGAETVLLVEDEPMLRELGYRVLNACNGVDALRVLAEHSGESIDLLVTDVVMPEMGGTELAVQMRSRSPRTKVLFCSGYTEDAITRDGLLQPGTSFMQKPSSVATLAGRVREVLVAN